MCYLSASLGLSERVTFLWSEYLVCVAKSEDKIACALVIYSPWTLCPFGLAVYVRGEMSSGKIMSLNNTAESEFGGHMANSSS